jgi:Transposase
MAAASLAHAHDPVRVTVGVDTHKDSHLGHAKDELGRDLGQLEVPTTARAYAALLAWARSHGEVVAFGVEGTSSYGIGLSRYLQGEGHLVLEVIRPGRQDRRLRGKSDPLDAEAAAAAVLSGKARHLPRASAERVEMIRSLRIARASAIKARTQAMNAIKALIVMAPEAVRDALRTCPMPTSPAPARAFAPATSSTRPPPPRPRPEMVLAPPREMTAIRTSHSSRTTDRSCGCWRPRVPGDMTTLG